MLISFPACKKYEGRLIEFIPMKAPALAVITACAVFFVWSLPWFTSRLIYRNKILVKFYINIQIAQKTVKWSLKCTITYVQNFFITSQTYKNCLHDNRSDWMRMNVCSWLVPVLTGSYMNIPVKKRECLYLFSVLNTKVLKMYHNKSKISGFSTLKKTLATGTYICIKEITYHLSNMPHLIR